MTTSGAQADGEWYLPRAFRWSCHDCLNHIELCFAAEM